MRALLIDNGDIREVEIGLEFVKTLALLDGRDIPEDIPEDISNLHSMYYHIGCTTVCGPGYPDQYHACWADDEGLFVENQQVHATAWYPEPLVGKLLITGFDASTGDTTAATMSVESLAQMVRLLIAGDGE